MKNFKFAPSPYVGDWSALDDPFWTFEHNPVEITVEEETRGETFTPLNGERKRIDPIWPDSLRKVTRRNLSITLPETKERFARTLKQYHTFQKPIAFRFEGLWDEAETINIRREKLESDSTNSYYYTAWGNYDPETIKVYDFSGNLIYDGPRASGNSYGLVNTTNTYGFAMEPWGGRISTSSQLPAAGELRATYDSVVWGKIVGYEERPMPGTVPTAFAPVVKFEEYGPWPSARSITRLYLRTTEATGIHLAPTAPGGTTEDAGHGPVHKNTLRKLDRNISPGPYVQVAITAEIASNTEHHDWIGSWISDPLVAQVIPRNTAVRMAGSVDLLVSDPSDIDAKIHGFVYLWRPGVGFVACLSQDDPWGTIGMDTPFGENPSIAGLRVWRVATATLGENVEVRDSDRIVLDTYVLYHQRIANPYVSCNGAFSYGGTIVGAAVGKQGSTPDSADDGWQNDSPASFLEFSHPVWFKE